jgi:hypothetical protein
LSQVVDVFERLFALETFGIKLGLENIGRQSLKLAHPDTHRELHQNRGKIRKIKKSPVMQTHNL